MSSEKITNKQMQLLIFIYPIGSFSLFNMGAGAKQNAWLATAIGVIFSLPILLMYGRLMNLYPGKNLFEILEIVFGVILGKIFNIVFVFHVTFIGSYILHNVVDFIKVTALWNTPIFIPYTLISVLIIWILKEGIEVLWGWAKFNIRLILVLMVFTWFLLIPQMHLSNLQPILDGNLKVLFQEGTSLAIYPFVELFIFLSFFDLVKHDNNTKNIFLKPALLSGIFVTACVLVYLMVLGGTSYTYFYYPGFESMKRMHFMKDFQRGEILVSVFFTIFRFLEICYCLLGSCKGFQKIFNLKDYKNIIVPVVLLSATFAYIMFGSAMEAKEFVADLWTFYGFLLEVLLPSLIFIAALIMKKFFKRAT